jgi:predicted Holliday junction resolvase-like endonuclease
VSHGVSSWLFAAAVVAVVVFAVAWARGRGARVALARQVEQERGDAAATRAELDERRRSHPFSETDKEHALASSRGGLAGTAAEQMAPFLPGYPHDPRVVRHFGGRIDQIAFPERDGKLWVVLIEVKKGAGGVEPRQAQVRDAIRHGRVEWQVVRVVETSDGAHCVVDETLPVEETPPAADAINPAVPPRATRPVLVRSEDRPAGRKVRLHRPPDADPPSSPPGARP